MTFSLSSPPYIAASWDVLAPNLIYPQSCVQFANVHLRGEKSGPIAGMRLDIAQKGAVEGDRTHNSTTEAIGRYKFYLTHPIRNVVKSK
jgi:hypothetical protein